MLTKQTFDYNLAFLCDMSTWKEFIEQMIQLSGFFWLYIDFHHGLSVDGVGKWEYIGHRTLISLRFLAVLIFT